MLARMDNSRWDFCSVLQDRLSEEATPHGTCSLIGKMQASHGLLLLLLLESLQLRQA